MVAKRLQDFDSSAIRQAFALAHDIVDPIDLSIGYPEDDTPDYIKAAGIRAIKHGDTRYTPSNGAFELREAVASKLQRDNEIKVGPDQVTITPGLTTGILLAYLAILDPGDEMLIPQPYFPPYRDLATMVGATPVLIDTFPSFQLTAAQIAASITPKTKALLINSPNNPSGAIYPESELRKIAAVAKKHNIIIISDEIYEHFSYDVKHFSIGSIYSKTLTLNGFSKAYAMTGWRVGYIAGPYEIIEAINQLQQYVVFSTSSISQKAALAAFAHSPAVMTNKYWTKRDLIVENLKDDFKLEGAEGAFYAFLKLPDGITDMEFIAKASQLGVIVLPGSAFSTYHTYIRVAFAAKRSTLIKGIKIIRKLVREMQGDMIAHNEKIVSKV